MRDEVAARPLIDRPQLSGREDLAQLNSDLLNEPSERVLQWAWKTFGPRVAASSSFQTQSVPILHMISRTCPEMDVLFLDTGFHFPETLRFRDELTERLSLKTRTIHPEVPKRDLFERYGAMPYRSDPDSCCHVNKVLPMQQVMKSYSAWISGIRREQTENRKEIEVVESRGENVVRVHPILNWTSRDVWNYIDEHDLPVHPLFYKGYPSIGCAPCTRHVGSSQNERDGRWHGTDKTECGLHTDLLRASES